MGLFYALVSALGHGGANYLNSVLSLEHGIVFILNHFIPGLLLWATYHLFYIVKRWRKTGKLQLVDRPRSRYFQPQAVNAAVVNSEPKYVFNRFSIRAPVRRCLNNLMIMGILDLTFYSASEAGLNTGIITSIFATCIIFTSICFYFMKGEKPGLYDFLGGAMIVTCVLLISLSPASGKEAGGSLLSQQRESVGLV